MVLPSLPIIFPIQEFSGKSHPDYNFDQTYAISNLAKETNSLAQLANLESIITFPGFRRAFHYCFDHKESMGVPSTMFGPVLIQLQPLDSLAAMLYLEKFPNYGIGYSIHFRQYTIENELPVFSEEVVDSIHVAQNEDLQRYFNRIHPASAVLSTLILLANEIYRIDHGYHDSAVNFLDPYQNQPDTNFNDPGQFLLAPYGRDVNGHSFGIENPEDFGKFGGISGSWKEDFYDLLINFRKFIPPLMEYANAHELAPEQPYFINKSLGPIRIKYVSKDKALGLFVHLRANSARSYEFWIGEIPYKGNQKNPCFNYNQISVIKRNLTSADFTEYYPTLDSVDLLLPLFLQASELLQISCEPYRGMREIIDECKKNYPRETSNALDRLAKRHDCPIHRVIEKVDEEVIKESLHQSISAGREFNKILKEIESFKDFGDRHDAVIFGSLKRFSVTKNESQKSTFSYTREKMEIERKRSHYA